ETDLKLTAVAGTERWGMAPSSSGDMIIKSGHEERPVRLADAKKTSIVPYDAGFKTGLKISLSQWPGLDLEVFLTVCLEGLDEEVVFDVSARESKAVLREIDGPEALEAQDVDDTLLSNGRGTLLPRNWPKEYYPIRSITPDGKIAPTDHSLLQSKVIESWSRAWWGFQKRKSAAMVIIETPDDASYQFSHPAGGPTIIGPRW